MFPISTMCKTFGVSRVGVRHGAFDTAARELIEANAGLTHVLAPLLEIRLEFDHSGPGKLR